LKVALSIINQPIYQISSLFSTFSFAYNLSHTLTVINFHIAAC
jgi:hypothetical protein